jgi:hypothetical protein
MGPFAGTTVLSFGQKGDKIARRIACFVSLLVGYNPWEGAHRSNGGEQANFTGRT